MIHFVGAGCGAPDLITVRGQRLLEQADCIVYAGSLVNPALLEAAKPGCEIHDSARLTLEQVIAVLEKAHRAGGECVRLHTGEPSLYGAVREQMDMLDKLEIPYDVTPGVSAFGGAAAALYAEYTLPGVSQTLIITRMAGRTPVPEGEALAGLAGHGASMAVYLSAGLMEPLREQLLAGGCRPETPAAIVYKASWPEEKVVRGTVGILPELARENGIERTALILVGEFLEGTRERSKLYDPAFSHGYRAASQGINKEGDANKNGEI